MHEKTEREREEEERGGCAFEISVRVCARVRAPRAPRTRTRRFGVWEDDRARRRHSVRRRCSRAVGRGQHASTVDSTRLAREPIVAWPGAGLEPGRLGVERGSPGPQSDTALCSRSIRRTASAAVRG